VHYTHELTRTSSHVWLKSGAQHFVCQVQRFLSCSHPDVQSLMLACVLRCAVHVPARLAFDPLAGRVSAILGERTFTTADPPDWDADAWLVPVGLLHEPTGGLLCSCKCVLADGTPGLRFTGPQVTSGM
jgi:hypothetical protein